jgi:hypothetical protein
MKKKRFFLPAGAITSFVGLTLGLLAMLPPRPGVTSFGIGTIEFDHCGRVRETIEFDEDGGVARLVGWTTERPFKGCLILRSRMNHLVLRLAASMVASARSLPASNTHLARHRQMSWCRRKMGFVIGNHSCRNS